MTMNLNAALKMVLMVLGMIVLISCGGGGGASSEGGGQKGNSPIAAQFVDSYVQGLQYKTATQNGTTNANGTFYYLSGETVSFYVGDILIGSMLVNGKEIITPFDLVPGAKNIDDPVIGNILRFLITLDDNSNPDDGINILPDVSALAMGLSLDFTMTTGFDAAASTILSTITGGAKTALVDYSVVQTHFTNTLVAYLEGDYSGTYTGSGDNGSWTIAIDALGNITGTSTSSTTIEIINLTGTLNDNASFTLSGTSGAVTITYEGQFDYFGAVSGTWSDTINSGVFSNSNTGGGGVKVNDLSFFSSQYGPKQFNRTKPVQTQVLGTYTTYSFVNDPEGWPETFTPNYDMLTVSVVVDNATGNLVTVLFGYFNTGSDPLVVPDSYYYQLVCDPMSNPCLSISFSAIERRVTFFENDLPPDLSTPDFPNAATTYVTVSGSVYW
jgi:hypothetical protein